MAEYQALVNRATNVANTPYSAYSGEMVAPLTSQTLQGLGNINNYAYSAQQPLNTAAQMTQGAAGAISPQQFSSGALQPYMDPYTQSVINATQAEFNNQNKQQAQFLNSANISSGAFGGDRAGVGQAILSNQQQLAQAPVIAGLNQANFSQAMQEFNNQQQTNLAAQQADAARALQAAGQLGNIGTAQQQAGLQGATAQTQAGTIPQAEQQQIDQALQQLWQTGQAYPFQTTSWLGNIIEGIGSQSGGQSTTTSPGPSSTSQGVGAAVAGLGLLANFLPFSDERAKEDIEPIGKTFDNQTIYRYRMKGDPREQIGLIAQEVEGKYPHAVHRAGLGGLRHLDYGAATDEAADRGHFDAGGGVPMPGSANLSPRDALSMMGVGAARAGTPQAPIAAAAYTPQGMLFNRQGFQGGGGTYIPYSSDPFVDLTVPYAIASGSGTVSPLAGVAGDLFWSATAGGTGGGNVGGAYAGVPGSGGKIKLGPNLPPFAMNLDPATNPATSAAEASIAGAFPGKAADGGRIHRDIGGPIGGAGFLGGAPYSGMSGVDPLLTYAISSGQTPSASVASQLSGQGWNPDSPQEIANKARQNYNLADYTYNNELEGRTATTGQNAAASDFAQIMGRTPHPQPQQSNYTPPAAPAPTTAVPNTNVSAAQASLHGLMSQGGRLLRNSGGMIGQMGLHNAMSGVPQGQGMTGATPNGEGLGALSAASTAAGDFGNLFGGPKVRQTFQGGGGATLDQVIYPGALSWVPQVGPLGMGAGPPRGSPGGGQSQQGDPVKQGAALGQALGDVGKKIKSGFSGSPSAPSSAGTIGSMSDADVGAALSDAALGSSADDINAMASTLADPLSLLASGGAAGRGHFRGQSRGHFDDGGDVSSLEPPPPIQMEAPADAGGYGGLADSPALVALKDRISQIESGGQPDPYLAAGPATHLHGRGYNDAAVGRYQTMGLNVPEWTQKNLGFAMTPEQFRQSPQAQERVASGQLGSYLDKYGSPGDAASMWFTGRPLAQGARLRDQLGTSGSKYAHLASTLPLKGGVPAMPPDIPFANLYRDSPTPMIRLPHGGTFAYPNAPMGPNNIGQDYDLAAATGGTVRSHFEGGGDVEDTGAPPTREDILQYNTAGAQARGLNVPVVTNVLKGEMGAKDPYQAGDANSSFNPWQMHVGGINPAMAQPGMGDDYRRDTGHDPADPHYWREQSDYALDYIKRHGLSPWLTTMKKLGYNPQSAWGEGGGGGGGANYADMPAPAAQAVQGTYSTSDPDEGRLIPHDAATAMMMAGFGMMAGRSPWAMVNIGQGAMEGMNYYQQTHQLDRQWAKTQAEIENLSSEARVRNADVALKSQQLSIEQKKWDLFLKQIQAMQGILGDNSSSGASPSSSPAAAPPAKVSPTVAGPVSPEVGKPQQSAPAPPAPNDVADMSGAPPAGAAAPAPKGPALVAPGHMGAAGALSPAAAIPPAPGAQMAAGAAPNGPPSQSLAAVQPIATATDPNFWQGVPAAQNPQTFERLARIAAISGDMAAVEKNLEIAQGVYSRGTIMKNGVITPIPGAIQSAAQLEAAKRAAGKSAELSVETSPTNIQGQAALSGARRAAELGAETAPQNIRGQAGLAGARRTAELGAETAPANITGQAALAGSRAGAEESERIAAQTAPQAIAGAAAREGAIKGAGEAAAERAKAPYEMVEVTDADGTKHLVPKAALVGAQGVSPQNFPTTQLPDYVKTQQNRLWEGQDKLHEQYVARQDVEQRMRELQDIQKYYKTGSLAEHQREAVALAQALNIPLPQNWMNDATAFDRFQKDAIANVFGQIREIGGQVRVAEIQGLQRANASAPLTPEANARILAQGLGILHHASKYYEDYATWHRQHPGAYDDSDFTVQWAKENPVEKYVNDEVKNAGYKGQFIPYDPKDRIDGQVYQNDRGMRARWNAATQRFTQVQ